jgi:hypothetical protein
MAISILSSGARPCASLTSGNRAGYRSFITRNILHPRLTALAFCLLALFSLPVHAESSSLPNAPTATTVNKPLFGVMDYSLVATIVSERVLDFTSTEECIRRPAAQCHEVELPTALVRNKAAFAAFEAGTASLSLFEQYELTKHGHRKLAWAIQGANAAFMGFVVSHNYKLAR